jgi:hypothetical protein
MPEVLMSVARTLLALLVVASAGSAVLGDELRTLDGKSYMGNLVSATNKQVDFKTATEVVKAPVSLVLDVTLQPPKPLGPDVKRIECELSDGSHVYLKPDGLVIKGTKAELTLFSGQILKTDLKEIVYFLKDAQEPVLQQKMREIMAKRTKTDRLLRLKVDEKTKKPDLEFVPGTFGDADEKGETIDFKVVDGKPIKPRMSNIQGIIFYRPTEASQIATVCQVRDVNGALLIAQAVSFDKNGFKITLVAGPKMECDAQSVAKLNYNIDKLNYLSDMDPTKVVEKSGSGLVNRYRRDKNLDDGPIRLDGKPYSKGLSMHSYTELEYNLGGKYKEFSTLIGVDDQVGGDSKALVTIECNGDKVFSKEITRATKDYLSKPLVIKVKDVATLRIIVSSKNVLDLHDHVTFANPKVSQ